MKTSKFQLLESIRIPEYQGRSNCEWQRQDQNGDQAKDVTVHKIVVGLGSKRFAPDVHPGQIAHRIIGKCQNNQANQKNYLSRLHRSGD